MKHHPILRMRNGEVRVNRWKSVLALLLMFSPAFAHESDLFFVDGQAIREIAKQAVLEKYPGIAPDDLEEQLIPEIGLDVNCRSALKSGLVSSAEDDFEYCSVQIEYRIASTWVTERLIDTNGQCVVSEHYESIHVLVHSDGSTMVGSRGGGSSRNARRHPQASRTEVR